MPTPSAKAGTYEVLVDRYDHPTNKKGEPREFLSCTKGDLVDLDAEQAERLLSADAVGAPGAREKILAEHASQTAAAAKARYETAQAEVEKRKAAVEKAKEAPKENTPNPVGRPPRS